MRLAVAALLVALAALPARAQSQWADMPVPTAALALLQVPLDAARPLAMLRAIRVRQSIEVESDALSPPLLELERLLNDLERVEADRPCRNARNLAGHGDDEYRAR